MTINHDTSNEVLATTNKRDLIAAMGSRVPAQVLAGLSKSELVNRAMRFRDGLADEKAAADAREEAQRQAVLTAEAADPNVAALLAAAVEAVASMKADVEKKLSDAQAAIGAASLGNVAYELARFAEQTMYADALYRELFALHGYLSRQADQKSRIPGASETMDQIESNLISERDRLVERCLRNSDYEHSSTSSLSNLRSVHTFKATQTMARLMQAVCKRFMECRSKPEMIESFRWLSFMM